MADRALVDVPLLYERLGREYHARLAVEEDLEALRELWSKAVHVMTGIKSGSISVDRLEIVDNGFRVTAEPAPKPSNVTDLNPDATSAS